MIRFKQVEHILSEKNILSILSQDQHPFIVNLASSFQDECCLYMVLEMVSARAFIAYTTNLVVYLKAGHLL